MVQVVDVANIHIIRSAQIIALIRARGDKKVSRAKDLAGMTGLRVEWHGKPFPLTFCPRVGLESARGQVNMAAMPRRMHGIF